MQTTQQPTGRKAWNPIRDPQPKNAWTLWTCEYCHLPQKQHINRFFCPEWRLRQLDGDR